MIHKETAVQTAAAAPGVGAIALYVTQANVSMLAALLGAVFLVLQIWHHVWKMRRDRRHEAERIARGLPPPEKDE